MPRVYGLHEVIIHPDHTDEEFEKFVKEELPKVQQPAGSKLYVLKGNRGYGAGRFLLVYEFDSVETQNRLWPGNLASDEMKAWQKENADFLQKWSGFFEHTMYTDYVELNR